MCTLTSMSDSSIHVYTLKILRETDFGQFNVFFSWINPRATAKWWKKNQPARQIIRQIVCESVFFTPLSVHSEWKRIIYDETGSNALNR